VQFPVSGPNRYILNQRRGHAPKAHKFKSVLQADLACLGQKLLKNDDVFCGSVLREKKNDALLLKWFKMRWHDQPVNIRDTAHPVREAITEEIWRQVKLGWRNRTSGILSQTGPFAENNVSIARYRVIFVGQIKVLVRINYRM
jgi:hypothetical protein